MAGAGQLPLIVSPTIASIKLYHVLIDGGAALNLISLIAIKKLQILMLKLQPSHPFSGVGPMSVMPHDCISLAITFGTPSGQDDPVLVYGGCPLRVPSIEDAISECHRLDMQRPRCRHLYAGESLGSGGLL
jgi:hypothetical protein